MTPKETTHYAIRMRLDNKIHTVNLSFLKQEYGVSVQDVWIAWLDDNTGLGSRYHGENALECVQNMVNSIKEAQEFSDMMREQFRIAMECATRKFRTPVIP